MGEPATPLWTRDEVVEDWRRALAEGLPGVARQIFVGLNRRLTDPGEVSRLLLECGWPTGRRGAR